VLVRMPKSSSERRLLWPTRVGIDRRGADPRVTEPALGEIEWNAALQGAHAESVAEPPRRCMSTTDL